MYFMAYSYDNSVILLNYALLASELLFSMEIILSFFTSYKDKETYEEIFSVRLIAINYIF